ncbi:sodium/hydrogen exchanger family protein [Phlyctema vagabunda]|uniref:Sodium/hydrogen exchanger family protein n=1 Tax=Phlyctema vagabunda TaxID=108571 RepID=A0ABR4PX23_9HELO
MAVETSNTITSVLPYHEPGIITILIQASFLLILNVVNHAFDLLIFCGLIGQIFVGLAWGTPGGKLLDESMEAIIVQLGYLGLILLVYEGGLETSFKSLRANAKLSVMVALTGVCAPMGLSFVLMSLINATPLQAFAAGAALCSTSLGTTFTILGTSGLSKTRVGVVLTSAAMLDDVIGLIMVQVVSNLGTATSSSFSPVTVVRPIAVSIGFVILVPLVCIFLVKPITFWLNAHRKSHASGLFDRAARGTYTPFLIHTALLLALITAASYAGTSNLFAAYLAGASISWWDSELPHDYLDKVVTINAASSGDGAMHADGSSGTPAQSSTPVENNDIVEHTVSESRSDEHSDNETSGPAVYHKFYAAAVQRILKPFFFASIGFAIPITEMFSGEIFWRGVVFTILMLFAKLITGMWLVRLDISSPQADLSRYSNAIRKLLPKSWQHPASKRAAKSKEDQAGAQENITTATTKSTSVPMETSPGSTSQIQQTPNMLSVSQTRGQDQKRGIKPLSLYPAGILGTAMTARGEIGFLIASLAETTGVFSKGAEPSSGSSEIYLVVTWAIVLCTIIGPLSVGTLVKRVRRLQAEREHNPSKPDPLGVWGVN